MKPKLALSAKEVVVTTAIEKGVMQFLQDLEEQVAIRNK
jgi:hypothetical protein